MDKPAQMLQQQQQQQAHVLFDFSPLDNKEELDDRVQRTYQNLKQMIAGKSAKECHECYLKYIANSQHNLEDLTMGLLVALLAEHDGQQSKYYRDVVSFSKDGINLFSTYLNVIIVERLMKLRDHSIKQVFWITNQLMKAGITTVDSICSNLIRQAAGGDVSPRNLKFVESLLELITENRSWLINSTSFMVPTVIYTFMRLISDHMATAHDLLRQKEIDFVIGLVREKFLDCVQIGRDFLRLLHILIKIPEFEKLWHDIYNNPKSLHPTFQNPLQLLSMRTPRRLFQSRLTFDMERKISFLATQVKFGNQKRYQDWFQKQYLSTPESFSLRCDLIRYICTIIHPSNEVLCSDIIPRWAIIGWLLTTCTTSTSASNSRLALFFDWLLYDAKVDNIMNIEPAILVMFYSSRSHPQVTSGLLDFLCRIPIVFSPKLGEHIRGGLKKSLQQILEKRVIPTIAPLFDNPKHDPALKALIKETFPEFCASAISHADNGISQINQPVIPAQVNQPVTTSNHVSTKQPEIVLNDQDKLNVPKPDLTTNVFETVTSKTAPNQDHLVNRSNNESVPVIFIDDKLDHGTPPSSSRDEFKAFSWNGTENVNASYSHKQNHDNKSIRKSSITTNSNASGGGKKSKTVANADGNITDTSNNVPKSNISSNLSVAAPVSTEFNPDLPNSGISDMRVIYPFMTVQDIDLEDALRSFDEPLRILLEDLSVERCNTTRCGLMEKLISTISDDSEQYNDTCLGDLAHCLASQMVDDFSVRIFPSSNQDTEHLEGSIVSPLFVLCRKAFSASKKDSPNRSMTLLVAISRYFGATSFLVLYYLKVTARVNGTSVVNGYIEFCINAKKKATKCLLEDLSKAATYDSDMFCFFLPTVFGEMAHNGAFPITGNIDLIHLVVSTVDPVSLEELICLCLTNTARVLNKEEILPLIEASLNWESWEQYCVWKLISAQSVPVENYISILPKLDAKLNPEALSCIMLNLQKLSEPSMNIVQQVINRDSKNHDVYVSSILRYWSMKTDIKELARMISTIGEIRPSSPQVKRKGQNKTAASKSSSSLSLICEKVLYHLDSIRQRAPKNKLFAQSEIREMLVQLEGVCNDAQKKKFSDLFSNCPKPTKKQRKMDKEITP